jgi:ABC-type nitrate/sulfonate/bicarbonate transport system ATPase subunit
MLPMELNKATFDKKEARKRAEEMLALVGLSGFERPPPTSCRAGCATGWRSPAPW